LGYKEYLRRLSAKTGSKAALSVSISQRGRQVPFIESEQVAVLIPFDEKANVLLDELQNEAIPLHRSLLRGLQLYTVQVYRSKFLRNHAQFESVRDQQFHILICPETQYSSRFGLHLDSRS
jgi:hypothetical protein